MVADYCREKQLILGLEDWRHHSFLDNIGRKLASVRKFGRNNSQNVLWNENVHFKKFEMILWKGFSLFLKIPKKSVTQKSQLHLNTTMSSNEREWHFLLKCFLPSFQTSSSFNHFSVKIRFKTPAVTSFCCNWRWWITSTSALINLSEHYVHSNPPLSSSLGKWYKDLIEWEIYV